MTERDLIYDVGMCTGEDTAFYLKKGFRVIAFEADPDLIAMAKAQFADAIRSERLRVVGGAITDSICNSPIEFYKTPFAWGTTVKTFAERNALMGAKSQLIEVPRVDFRECLRRFGIPYYMKVDIEGADIVCLRSLAEFSDRPAYVSTESDKTDFASILVEIDMLESLGYRSFKAVNQQRVPKQHEPENTTEGTFTGSAFELGSSGLFGSDTPGKWLDKKQICDAYRRIFKTYRLLGDDALVRRLPLHKPLITGPLRVLFGIPGWYDTHARHESVIGAI